MVAITFVLGVLIAMFAIAMHDGVVDMPYVGIIASGLLVGSASWFVLEWLGLKRWLLFCIVMILAIIVKFYLLPGDDLIVGVDAFWTYVFMVDTPIVAFFPLIVKKIVESKQMK